MTQQCQIVPNYINPPRDPSWANGSVKDQGGQLWSVHKDALAMFAKGQPVNIGFEPPSGTKKYPQITMVSGMTIGQPANAGFQQVGQAAPAFQGTGQAWQPQTQTAAPTSPHSAGPLLTPGATSKECQIFVTGVIGRMMQGTGSFPDLETLRNMIFNAKLAWGIEMEGKPEPQIQVKPNPDGDWPNSPDGPPQRHPAGQEPPFDDPIPY